MENINKKRLESNLNNVYFSEDPHELEIINSLKEIIPQNVDVIFDIGASIGQYTYYINSLVKGKTIYSVEADPLRFDILSENCKKWEPLNSNKIIPLNLALFHINNATLDFYTTNSETSGAIFVNDNIISSNLNVEKIKIKTVTLDKLIEDAHANNFFIKMDIEGAEHKAILGGLKSLRSDKSITILVEVHQWVNKELKTHTWTFFKNILFTKYKSTFFKDHFILDKSNYLNGFLSNGYYFVRYFLRETKSKFLNRD